MRDNNFKILIASMSAIFLQACGQTEFPSIEEKVKWVFYSISFEDNAANTFYSARPRVDPLTCELIINKTIDKGDTTEYYLHFSLENDTIEYFSMPMKCVGLGFLQDKPIYTICDMEHVGSINLFFEESQKRFSRFIDTTSMPVPNWLISYNNNFR